MGTQLINPFIPSNGSITPAMLSQPFTAGTSVATTSGVAIDFTNIPSWVKRITLTFSGVSISGTSQFLIQLGDSGGVENTGYASGGARTGGGFVASATSTAGFYFANTTAATLFSGVITIANLTGNTWAANGILGGSVTEDVGWMGGAKTLSGTLDRLRITTVGGTDTFDAGTANILYE